MYLVLRSSRAANSQNFKSTDSLNIIRQPGFRTCLRIKLLLSLEFARTNLSKYRCELFARRRAEQTPEFDHLIDSFQVMLAQNGHAYTGKVARELADVGYWAAKRTYFHGVRLHCIAMKRFAELPKPSQIWLCEASHHDLRAAKERHLELPNTTSIADLAYPEAEFELSLKKQKTRLFAGRTQKAKR